MNKKGIAIFSKHETVLEISGHSKHNGTYEAKTNFGCFGCFFEGKNGCTFDTKILGNQKCVFFRRDNTSKIWIKKEGTEMTEAPVLQHKHFNLILAWAKNPTQQVWFWSSAESWEKVNNPTWTCEFYAIGDKPTEPPMTKVKVKIKLDLDNFIIEVPLSARMSEVEKAILDKAVQFVTYTHEFLN